MLERYWGMKTLTLSNSHKIVNIKLNWSRLREIVKQFGSILMKIINQFEVKFKQSIKTVRQVE